MKLYKKEDATIYANSDVCKNLEYNVDDKDINFSVAVKFYNNFPTNNENSVQLENPVK